jgi:hypothetical protein
MFRTLAETRKINVIGVGLGGATTNVYSVYDRRYVRTVSANLGMSYSICNVLKSAGINNIIRWLPFDIDEADLRDRLFNKMIRPTTIPRTVEELVLEHAVAREALRLGFNHHKSLARPLRGIRIQRDIGDMFDQEMFTGTYIDMMNVDLIGGTGGLLSHAPRRVQAAQILIDGFRPEGVTRLVQDSVFMIPHLGVLSTVHKEAALEIFEKDCIVRLGTAIAPRGLLDEGQEMVQVKAEMPSGDVVEESIPFGDVKLIPLEPGKTATVEIQPARECDVGAGPGHALTKELEGGVVGIIVDARGRPLALPDNGEERRIKLIKWFEAIGAYPMQFIETWKG